MQVGGGKKTNGYVFFYLRFPFFLCLSQMEIVSADNNHKCAWSFTSCQLFVESHAGDQIDTQSL